jgi:DNA-binding transcriptional MerR regulator
MQPTLDPHNPDLAEFFMDDIHGEGDHKSSLAFRTISEVAQEIDVPQHVLRFWESRFSQIKPLKRGGGRRYYRPEDIELLRRIKNYLYKQGYTIKGVQRLLKEKREATTAAAVPSLMPLANTVVPPASVLTPTSYLHAAAGSPSTLAMAYGAVAGRIQEESIEFSVHVPAQFSDAFEETTHEVPDKDISADVAPESGSLIARSLETVTRLHDEISDPVQPIIMLKPAEAVAAHLAEQQALAEVVEAVPQAAPVPLQEIGKTLKASRKKSPVADFDFSSTRRVLEKAAGKIMTRTTPAAAPAALAADMGELRAILAELTELRDMLHGAQA